MEEREIMEMEDMENNEGTEKESGMGTGKAIIVGAILGIAGTAIARFARKKWTDHKAKKEAKKFIECDCEEVEDESDSE